MNQNYKNILNMLLALLFSTLLSTLAIYSYRFICVRFSPPNIYHLHESVNHYLDNGKLQQAEKLAKHILQKKYEATAIKLSLARLKLSFNKYEDATHLLKSVLSEKNAPPFYLQSSYIKAFYHPEARLLLAKIAFEKGDFLSALVHAETAAAYTDLTQEKYAEFHPLLSQLYFEKGLWSRFLQFIDLPTTTNLSYANISDESLDEFIRVAESCKRWDILSKLGSEKVKRHAGDILGRYALARAAFANEQYHEVIELLQPIQTTQCDFVLFLLALAHEKTGSAESACEILQQIPPESVYRPFALIKLLNLSGTKNDDAEIELEKWFNAPLKLSITDAPRSFRKTSYVPETVYWEKLESPAFPILIRWKNGPLTTLQISSTDPSYIVATQDDKLLQLEMVSNKLFMCPLNDGDTISFPPGWHDKEYNLEGWPEGPYLTLAKQANEIQLLFTKENKHEEPRFRSNPVSVTPYRTYLCIGGIFSPDVPASLSWYMVDRGGWLSTGHHLLEMKTYPQETFAAATITPQYFWRAIKVSLGVSGKEGTAVFKNLTLVELTTPN